MSGNGKMVEAPARRMRELDELPVPALGRLDRILTICTVLVLIAVLIHASVVAYKLADMDRHVEQRIADLKKVEEEKRVDSFAREKTMQDARKRIIEEQDRMLQQQREQVRLLDEMTKKLRDAKP